MRPSACVHLSLTLLAVALLGSTAQAADPVQAPEKFSADTRGFGKVDVTATLSSTTSGKPRSWTVYRASDAAHAKVIAAKRVADLVGFGDVKVIDAVAGQAGTLLDGGVSGAWLIGVRGGECHEFYAPTRDDLTALTTGHTTSLEAVTPRGYPRWLDCFDNAAVGMWVGGGGDDYDIPHDFEYLKSHNLAMCTLPPDESRLVAPGLIDRSIYDWHSAIAAKYDLPYRALLFPTSPAWAWNITPLPYISPVAGYIPNQFMEYQAESIQHVFEPNPSTDKFRHDQRRRLAGSLASDPNLLGWHGCDEITEAGIPELSACADTPGMAGLWRKYLKDLGLDLATVGRMHTGDPAHYKSWDAVQVPVPVDFLGWDGATCIDLRGTWDVHPDPARAGEDAEWFRPGKGEGWTQAAYNDVLIEMYGKRYNGEKKELPFWMRRAVAVTPALLPTMKFLHIAHAKSQDHYQPVFSAWMNGTKLEMVKEDGTDWDQCFILKDTVIAGDNTLVLDTHGSPIPGHIFIGPQPVRRFPRMDPAQNRRWYDAIGFDAYLRIHTLEDNLIGLRAGDPDRPLKLMALAGMLDLSIPVCEKYGAYMHDTGGASGYWCPMSGARLSLAHGLPWSCEQGNPPNTAPEMQKEISFFVRYGNDAADLVFAVPEYTKKPEIAGWIEANGDLLHCIGKLHQPTPLVAVLRSTRDARLGYHEPWDWDLGRGGLQATGRNFHYVDTPDLATGRVSMYKVVIDDGTVLMTDEDIAGIEKYVGGGGIFIALHNTGRDSPERAESWPIAKLNGLTVVNMGTAGEMHFTKEQSLFPQLRDREVHGNGMVMDFRGADRTGPSLGLEKKADKSATTPAPAPGQDGAIETIAEWSGQGDGKGRIAIAARHLGKGEIITLGSTFWRDAKDANGAYRDSAGAQEVLDELLNSLGAPRESVSGATDCWAEHWQSKNGVFDVYPITYFNESSKGDEEKSFTVGLARSSAPEALCEVSAAGHPAITSTWKDGQLTFPTTTYGRMQTRVFLAPRADRARAGIDWFRWQSSLWRALPPIPADRKPEVIPVPANIQALADNWKMSNDTAPQAGEASATPAWTAPDAADADWKTIRLGAFATIGLPEDTVGRYRLKVTVPPAWKSGTPAAAGTPAAGQRIKLVFDAQGWFWGLVPQGRLWINGKPAGIPQPIKPGAQSGFTIDVTDAAASGTLTLALEVDGTKRDPSQARQYKPDGVTGMFYLQSDDAALRSDPLPPWSKASDFNALTPADPGKNDFVYLESTFTLPATRPGKRLFLTCDEPLGCLILNGHLVSTPAWMHRLDISHLVNSDATANVLRWAPGMPYSESVQHRPAPVMHLEWMP